MKNLKLNWSKTNPERDQVSGRLNSLEYERVPEQTDRIIGRVHVEQAEIQHGSDRTDVCSLTLFLNGSGQTRILYGNN